MRKNSKVFRLIFKHIQKSSSSVNYAEKKRAREESWGGVMEEKWGSFLVSKSLLKRNDKLMAHFAVLSFGIAIKVVWRFKMTLIQFQPSWNVTKTAEEKTIKTKKLLSTNFFLPHPCSGFNFFFDFSIKFTRR